MTDSTTPADPPEQADDASDIPPADGPVDASTDAAAGKGAKRKAALRETAILLSIALVLYYLMLTFVARPYLIPSESMEPTLHGCPGCTGDRIMVDKVTYRFGSPQFGDVIVFKGPPEWNFGYRSIRSENTAVRWVQNALSFVGFVPPDENDLVKRVIAVGGQTVECRYTTGLLVDGKPIEQPFLDPATLGVQPQNPYYQCLGEEFGPLKVPDDRLWVMGDNRTHSADSRAHCSSDPVDYQDKNIKCTGPDPDLGTVPLENVIGKARFIAWPPTRWGGVDSADHGLHVVAVPAAVIAGVCLLIYLAVRTVRRRL